MEALYFPYLSLPSSTWVNPALLYFDRISVIAPDGFQPGIFDRRTQGLMAEDLVRPVAPSTYPWDPADDEQFITFMLGKASSQQSDGKLSRIHVGKIRYSPIADALIASGLLQPADDWWLEGPEWAAAHLMSYLALQLAAHPQLQMSLVTDERAAGRVMVGRLPPPPMNRRLRAVTSLLPVPADVPPDLLARFREDHRRELFAFRDFVGELVVRDPLTDEGELRFAQRIDEAKELRDYLIGEIAGAGWREIGIPIALQAIATGAPLGEDAYLSAGAGLLNLSYAAYLGARAHGRSRRARTSPLVYSALVSRSLRPQSAARILR